MSERNIFFLTSYNKELFDDYTIVINEKNQSEYRHFEVGDIIIYVNELKLKENSEINIYIEDKKKNKNEYLLKPNLKDDETIYFLFNYDLNIVDKKIKVLNLDSIFFWKNDEKYLNKFSSNNLKFSIFYRYLFNKEKEIEKNKNLYFNLIETFLQIKEKNNDKFQFLENEDDYLPIDIIISILIIYAELDEKNSQKYKNLSELFSKIKSFSKRIKSHMEVKIIQIKENEDFYINGITKCLNKLLNYFDGENKNIILEIITIYFIKYRDKNLDILLSQDYKTMFINLFKNELLYLDEGYMDDEIIQKITNHLPIIQDIMKLININSPDYVSYFKKINDNFGRIFDLIIQFQSLNKILQIDPKIVSQEDDINKLFEIHEELLEKQENKGKFFISFVKIFEQYYDHYSQYENIIKLSELLSIVIRENEKFPSWKKIINLKSNIIKKIRDLLKVQIESKDINGKDIIYVLTKLKKEFKENALFN